MTGLIAQQQCVGPLHIPLADCAVVAQGFHGLTGAVTAIGEQPIKGLLDPAAMARLTVGKCVFLSILGCIINPISFRRDAHQYRLG